MQEHIHIHEKKAQLVVVITAITMIVEIAFGYYTRSLALQVEGYHMSTHVFLLGLTWLSYVAVRKYASSSAFSFSRDKLLSLTGFTSALALLAVAVIMIVEAIDRLMHPVAVNFSEAIGIAVVGMTVNGISAFFLHHDHQHSDHNIKAAYMHVLSDVVTSIVAIVALTGGALFHLYYLDAVSAIFSALVITRWAIILMKQAGLALIDFRRNKA